jgi:hypothetical protein
MNEIGSGGIGAVSVGISEPVVWLVLLLIVALVIFGGWKLAKLVWAAFSG